MRNRPSAKLPSDNFFNVAAPRTNTDKLVDTGARLRNLRREETDLGRIMDRGGEVSDILEVEHQLANVRETIETLDAGGASMEHRVIDATVAPTAVAQLADAWRAALANLQSFSIALAARFFIAIAFAPYLLVLALIALAVRRSWQRTTRRI